MSNFDTNAEENFLRRAEKGIVSSVTVSYLGGG